MSKIKWRRLALAAVCGMAFGTTCFAAGGIQRIEAYFNHDMQFTINGKAWTPQDNDGSALAPVIVNGTAYLPVRAVAEALGSQIEWNDAAKTIAITTAEGAGTSAERDRLIAGKIDEIKEKLKLGLTQEEVQALFAQPHEPAYDNGDLENGCDAYWKYDFFKEPGYSRQDIPDHVIDEEGLLSKKIGAYLFIGWKDGKLHLYSISYVNPKDHRVYMYVLHPDGTASEERVSP